MTQKQHYYTRQEHNFFDNLVTLVTGIAGLGTLLDAHQPFRKGESIALEGLPHVTNCELHLFPQPIIEVLRQNQWPTEMTLAEIPLKENRAKHPITLSGLHGVHGGMITTTFVQYFEAQRPHVVQLYSKDPQSWPSEWNFGRVVRNALVHRGEVSFDKPTSLGGSWRTLHYDYSDNGTRILYQDITAVELILLMEEMDVHL